MSTALTCPGLPFLPWLAGSRGDLGQLVRTEIPKWAGLVKDAGVQPE